VTAEDFLVIQILTFAVDGSCDFPTNLAVISPNVRDGDIPANLGLSENRIPRNFTVHRHFLIKIVSDSRNPE